MSIVADEALYAGLKALGRMDWPTGGEHWDESGHWWSSLCWLSWDAGAL